MSDTYTLYSEEMKYITKMIDYLNEFPKDGDTPIGFIVKAIDCNGECVGTIDMHGDLFYSFKPSIDTGGAS